MGKNMRGKKSLFVMLFLGLMMIVSFQIKLGMANQGTVESVEPWTSGTDTILNITVRHSNPTSSHYVNKVEVDIDGVVQNIDLPPTPIQSSPTFVVQFNMGELTATPIVKAKANCNLHGSSGWSSPVEVPEFSTIHLLLILAIVSSAVLLLRARIFRRKEKL